MLSFVERCAVGHATGLSLRIVVAGDLTLIYDGSLHENQQGNNNTQAARAATGAAARASTTKPSNKRYQAAAFQRHITSISCIIISITIVHCPICGAQLRPRRPRMPTMANAAGAQHALEAPRRSRHHGGEAIVTRSEPMRWGRVRGVGAVQAAGASMMDRACDALNGLSAERQRTVEFMARLGAVGADFMQQADMQDAAEQDALQDQARDILRREGRRRRQIDRRSRNSEAKKRKNALPGPPPLIALGYSPTAATSTSSGALGGGCADAKRRLGSGKQPAHVGEG